MIAPMNTKSLAYPYTETYNFGPVRLLVRERPLGGAQRVDRPLRSEERRPPVRPQGHLHRQGDLRAALQLRVRPQEELWKVIWHNHRYSEDWNGKASRIPKADDGVWYPGWEGVPSR